MRKQLNPADVTVMLLGAGLGTRLRPLTNTTPKVMLPLHDGRPLLEHTLCSFRDQGFTQFVINIHYLADQITEHFGDGSRFGVSIAYSDEREELLEVGGAIKKAAMLLSDPFILVYADHVHRTDLRPLLAAHTEFGGIGTLLLKPATVPEEGELAIWDLKTQRIDQWLKRPHGVTQVTPNMFMNTGFDVLQKSLLEYIPEGTKLSLDREILPGLINDKKLAFYGVPTGETILDIGTPEKYQAAKEWYQLTQITC